MDKTFHIMISIKRIYEEAGNDDGYRVLIDRLWPRGIAKDKAQLDEWLKDISPSDDLRKWFNHDPKKWEEFKKKYRIELKQQTESLEHLKSIERKEGKISLLYAAKTTDYNNAVVLKAVLEQLD